MSEDLSKFSMMDLFRMEAETHTAVLTEGLLHLEADPGATERIQEMMRAAHSLKGAARIVDLEPAVDVAHAMEDCFVAVQEGTLRFTDRDIDTLLRGLDLLRAIAAVSDGEIATWLEERAAEIGNAVADLEALLESSSGVQAAAALRAETSGAVPSLKSGLEAETSVTAAPPSVAPPSVAEPGATDPAAVERAPVAGAPAPVSGAPGPEASGAPGPEASLPESPERASASASAAAGSTTTAGAAAPPARASADRASALQTVRVAGESLSRLMELAAESLVGARRLEPIARGLRQLASSQLDIDTALSALRDRLAREVTTEASDELLQPLAHELETRRRIFQERLDELESFLRRTTDLSGRLYHEVLASRMRPFQDGLVAFPRLVRDLAKDLGKKVRFTVRGEATPVDRDVLAQLDASLNHMIRNALDHGLETPEERLASGKPPEGRLVLEARHRDGMLNITLADDGRGIDLERLRRKIVERRLASEDMARGMTEPELLDFLFLPAFSTAERVTSVSGRGVGLDVVQTLVQELGGRQHITTTPGQGTTFHLLLPISRSVIRALLLRISGETYAVPLSRADRVARFPIERKVMAEGRDYVHLEGVNVGLLSAHEVLELPPPESRGGEVCVLVVSDRQHQFGLEVDELLGEQDLVVRPLDSRLGRVPDISAAAVADDGTPVLIIDVDDLVRSIDRLLTSGRPARLRRESRAGDVEAQAARRVLVVDDSITVREMQRQLLESRGYAVDTAVDGMEGWNAVRLGRYDLVVTDVDMPRMTGIELIELLRREDRLRELPVIVVSYKDREEDRLRGLHAGANYYLTKSSFQDDTYLTAVDDLIGPGRP